MQFSGVYSNFLNCQVSIRVYNKVYRHFLTKFDGVVKNIFTAVILGGVSIGRSLLDFFLKIKVLKLY